MGLRVLLAVVVLQALVLRRVTMPRYQGAFPRSQDRAPAADTWHRWIHISGIHNHLVIKTIETRCGVTPYSVLSRDRSAFNERKHSFQLITRKTVTSKAVARNDDG